MINDKRLIDKRHIEFKAIATICALCGLGVVAHHSLNAHADVTPTTPQATARPASMPSPSTGEKSAPTQSVQSPQTPRQAIQPTQATTVTHSQNMPSVNSTPVQRPLTTNDVPHQVVNTTPQPQPSRPSVQTSASQPVQTTHPLTTSANVTSHNNINSAQPKEPSSAINNSLSNTSHNQLSNSALHQYSSISSTSNSNYSQPVIHQYSAVNRGSGVHVQKSSANTPSFKTFHLQRMPVNTSVYFKQSQQSPLVAAQPVININHVLGEKNGPKVLLGTTKLLGSTAPGGFPHDIDVTDYSRDVFAEDSSDYGNTGPQDGPGMYVPAMTATTKNSGIFCNNYNELGPQRGMKHQYIATNEASQQMTDALGYAYKHGYSNNVKALIVWATETGNSADRVHLNHVQGDSKEVSQAKQALSSPEGAADAKAIGLAVQNYRASGSQAGRHEQDVTVVKTGVMPKTTTVTTPPTTINNNNNNNNGTPCGCGTSTAGGSSSSSTGGSPSGNGNQQQGGNGNGTQGGGNGTQANGNGNNGGGNGSPANNPNNSNNPNNGQPNNANPNNDDANNVIVPSGDSDGGSTSNNNNIVPSGSVINNNDDSNGSLNNVSHSDPDAINYNDNYDDLLAALINNEDRDNQDALNRLSSDNRAKESYMTSTASANASVSAANVLAAEKGKNTLQIQSMNDSASVQAIDNSLAADSALKSFANSASFVRNSYMNSLDNAEAVANSNAQNTIDVIDHMPNLTKQQRNSAFNEIQSGENSFTSAAIFGSATAPNTDLNAEMKHIEAIVESEGQKSYSSTGTVPANQNQIVAPINDNHSTINSNTQPTNNNPQVVPLMADTNYTPIPPDQLFSDNGQGDDQPLNDDFDEPSANTQDVNSDDQQREYNAGYKNGSEGRANHMMMESSPDYRTGYNVYQSGYNCGLQNDYEPSSDYTGAMLNDFNNAYSMGVAASNETLEPSDTSTASTDTEIPSDTLSDTSYTDDANPSDAESNDRTLPQTGDNNQRARILGLISLGLGSATLAGDELRKRKYRRLNNK